MWSFEINKYLGTWYELIHYPSWFQRNDNYNTTANYQLNPDGTIRVHNSTITQGEKVDSYGTATRIDKVSLYVDFSQSEQQNLIDTKQFVPMMNNIKINSPNYVIDKIWYNNNGDYIFAVVTDPKLESLYVLSRYPNPSLIAYNEIMKYVVAKYDRDRLVQTPHFI